MGVDQSINHRQKQTLYTPAERARRDATVWTLVQGILAPLTEAIFAAPNRALRGDWPAMRWHLGESLPPSAVALLELAAGACPNFERFFWHFARPSYAFGPTDDAGLPKN